MFSLAMIHYWKHIATSDTPCVFVLLYRPFVDLAVRVDLFVFAVSLS